MDDPAQNIPAMESELTRLLVRRRSVRAYLDSPVPLADLQRMCRLARLAPSGANLQPGSFHVLTGDPLRALTHALQGAIDAGQPQSCEYSYFPDPMPPHLKARQRAAGFALYGALGIDRRDVAGRRAQFRRNYGFFGAPVGVVVTIRRDMGKGCFMDLGMSLMALLLAAEDMGYGATGIGALANYGPVVHRHLALPDDELVVCGIAIGRPDPQAPENGLRTTREDLPAFASFRGFPG